VKNVSEIDRRIVKRGADKGSRKLLGPAGFVVAAAAGIAVGVLWPDTLNTPRMNLEPEVHMAPLRQGEPLRPQPKGLITNPQVAQRFVVWSQSVFRGELSVDAVNSVIAAQRAESLDKRLREGPAARLRESLFDVDQEILQLADQYREEYERIGAELRSRSTGGVVVRTHPRETDVAWPEVEKMITRVRRGEGLLCGKYTEQVQSQGKEPPLIYVFIAWDEWPALNSPLKKGSSHHATCNIDVAEYPAMCRPTLV
jgi:hypothetical protein